MAKTSTGPAKREERHHLRTSKGDVEIDLVFDLGRRRVVAVEFKAAATVDRRDAKHLITLRDELGPDFLAGVVLYSGSHLVELDDRVYGVPLLLPVVLTIWAALRLVRACGGPVLLVGAYAKFRGEDSLSSPPTTPPASSARATRPVLPTGSGRMSR